MATYADVQTKKNQLIRKGLQGSVFAGPTSAAALTAATLFDGTTGALAESLPSGYSDLGWLTEDGAQFARKVDASDITSWGSTDPTRSDVTSDVTTLQVACQETNVQTIGIYTGADMSAVVPNTDGSVEVAKPAVGNVSYHRVFSLSVDQGDDGEIYIVRFLPRVKVSDYDDQAFANGDDPTLWSVTFTAYADADLGFSEKFLFGGPGWKALLGDMGFQSLNVAPAAKALSVDATQQLTVTDVNGTNVTASCSFVSSASGVASVSSTGLVTGVAAGTATITASKAGLTATSVITVTA